MDLAEVLRTAGRRWYFLVVGLLITAGLAFAVFRIVPITYDVKASVLLLPPSVVQDPTGEPQVVNPFLNLGGLDVAAGVLAKALTDTATVETVIPEGSSAEYTVEKDASVSGSVLEVAVNAESEAEALSMLQTLVDLAESRLNDLQEAIDAPSNTEVRLMVVTDNDVAEPNYSTLLRALIVVVAGGIVLTLLLTVSGDALLRRRAARKNGTSAPFEQAQAAAPSGAGSREPADARVVTRTDPDAKRPPGNRPNVPRFDQDALAELAPGNGAPVKAGPKPSPRPSDAAKVDRKAPPAISGRG